MILGKVDREDTFLLEIRGKTYLTMYALRKIHGWHESLSIFIFHFILLK